MKKYFLTIVASTLAFSALAIPYAGYLYPAGVKAGTTVRVLIGGQNLGGAVGGVVSGKGVRVKRVVVIPNFPLPDGSQRAWLYKWIAGIEKGNKEKPPFPAPEKLEGWRKCDWWMKLDQLEPMELTLVIRNLHVRRNPLQQTPSLRGMMIIDVEADANAAPGVRELRIYGRRGVSAPKLFFVDKCDHYQEPEYVAPHKPRPETPYVKAVPAVVNGQVMPGETDSFIVKLDKETEYTFTLTGRRFQPFIGDAVPGHFQPVLEIIAPDGKQLAFADDEYFQPDPVLRFKSGKAGDYLLKIRDNLYRGRQDFVYRVALEKGNKRYQFNGASLTECDEASEPETRERRLYIGRPLVIFGALEKPGEKDTYRFNGKRNMNFHAEIAGRKDGSPLDAVLTLYAPDGKVLAKVDDSAKTINVGENLQQIDPEITINLPVDGVYKVVVSELNNAGGKDYRYRLKLGKTEADFNVYTVRSMCNIGPGGSGSVKAMVERTGGFAGDIRITGDRRYVAQPQVVKATVSEFNLQLRNPERRFAPPRDIKIYAEAEVNGKLVRKEVVPADIFNQAFAYDHLLPVQSFCIGTRGGGSSKKMNKSGKKAVVKAAVKPAAPAAKATPVKK